MSTHDKPNAQAFTLTDFLLARIAEDEVGAREELAMNGHGKGSLVREWRRLMQRMLAESDAKRRIIEDCQFVLAGVDDDDNPRRRLAEGVLRKLAWPYADHPDYPRG